MTTLDGEALAQRFHEAYERLAPSFGYETREASAKPWADVPDQNKRLMIAVCGEMLAALSQQPSPVAVGDLAAFGASEAAGYLYPDEDQRKERAAFCESAAHAVSTTPSEGADDVAQEAALRWHIGTALDSLKPGMLHSEKINIIKAALARTGQGYGRGVRVDEDHPMLAPILTLRRVNAADFSPTRRTGAAWEAYDQAVLDCYHAVEAALAAPLQNEEG